MTSFFKLQHDPELEKLYPSSDGKPMADNTQQYRWIVLIKENLELIFTPVDNVFVAADLLWYPIDIRTLPETDRPKQPPSSAPDVMVAFGRPKGDRPCYRQWLEDNIPPQVVFEILSESNRTSLGRKQMDKKFAFYQQYGVEEYYIYDPDEWTLQGWRRRDEKLVPIAQMSDWISPRLRIRFAWEPETELKLFRPDGERFISFIEVQQLAQEAQRRAEQETLRAEQQRLQAAQERSRAEQERSRAEQEHSRAEQAEKALQDEQARTARMATLLRSMGVDPNTIE